MRQSELGEKFGVDQSTISRDIDTLGEYVDETLGDRRQLTTDAVVQRCIAELLEEGKWKDAGNLTLKYDEWLAREADLSEMQEQLQAILDANGAGDGESKNGDGDGGPGVELTFEG